MITAHWVTTLLAVGQRVSGAGDAIFCREKRLSGVILLAISVAVCACNTLPRSGTKGTMPPPGEGGQVDPSAMPDFIAVAGNVGQVGWVEKAAVSDPSDQTWPVYADDLRTVVGHLVPGRGFVPTGVDPNAVPTKDVQVGAATPVAAGVATVMVYVRNCSDVMAWIAVVSGGHIQAVGSGGFWPNGYIGAGDFNVSAGDQLIVVNRDPREVGAVARQLIFARGSDAGPVTRSVNIGTSGNAVVGIGTPPWWEGVKPPC
ncbi:MAG: hypothetical protein QOI92_228 [Chloroflexota bacterium]|jgi:hypothetical protein|nr:hypothetical protein [Chloroflexota bacterium]